MVYEDNKAIGLRIRKKREELHLSREKLAEKMSISARFLSDIELGNKGMSQNTLLTLCDLLYTTPNYILLGTDSDEKDSRLVQIARSVQPKYQTYVTNILLSVISEMEEFERDIYSDKTDSE